jgi:uncharacterized repeat protein (TIGR01451 family)
MLSYRFISRLLRWATALLFVCSLFLPRLGAAQEFEWAKIVVNTERNSGIISGVDNYSIDTDVLGNTFILIGFDGTVTINGKKYDAPEWNNDFCLLKYNATGKLVWVRHYNNHQVTSGQVKVDNAGNCYITGSYIEKVKIGNFTFKAEEYYDDFFIAKVNTWGEVLWAKNITGKNDIVSGNLYIEDSDNINFYGQLTDEINFDDQIIQPLEGEKSYICKLDRNGKVIWIRKMGMREFVMEKDKLGNYLFTGEVRESINFGDTTLYVPKQKDRNTVTRFICKYTSDWKLQWVTHIIGVGDVSSGSIALDSEGNSYLTGRYSTQLIVNQDTLQALIPSESVSGRDAYIAKYDVNGKPVWGLPVAHYWSWSYLDLGKIINDGTENFIISGQYIFGGKIGTFDFQTSGSSSFIAKITRSGKIVWVKEPRYTSNYCLSSTDRKGNIYFIQADNYTGGVIGTDTLKFSGDEGVFLAKLRDTTFLSINSPYKLAGKIYHDNNSNCRMDPDESPLSEQILKVEPGSHYASTDSLGNYVFYLNAGNYTVSQIMPDANMKGLTIRQVCPTDPFRIVKLDSVNQTISGFNFGNQITKLPSLKVEVATDRRRRCFSSITTLRYCNEGYASASNVQVQVTYPQYVIPISASTAWSSRKDSLLTFNIGTLAPGACGTITLTDSVICGNEAIRGLTQCVKAVITPKNNLSAPDPKWDKSEVELKAVCKNNGFVRLTLLNPGKGAMADSAAYRIYLDAVKVFEGKYKLVAKDSLSLEVPVNGKTIRLEADLRPFHPDGSRQPSITLEGCGTAGTVNISKGFVNQLPQDDAPEEVAVSCLEILDSYDPNDKQASPVGVGDQHLITEKEELEYLIRFQNTGTDVAYNVVVSDTLDEHLDIASLQIGAASHPFTWKVSGQGQPVITWTFSNINLPDSNSNEPGSHGYLRFRIGQKAGNTLGTVITNQAAITFDYNSPILTNLTSHTIGEIPQQLSSAAVDVCKGNYPTHAQAGEDISLSTLGTTTLKANAPLKGRGQWKLISGKATIAEPNNPQSVVTGLGAGANILEWSITLCDSISRSRLTVERIIAPPQASNPTPVCSGETMPLLTATGTNLAWYADAQLAQKLAQGANFQPTTGEHFYVTQTVDGYQSKPAQVTVTIQARPAPPAVVVPARVYCQGESIEQLQASGESLRWYADAPLTQLLGTGPSYQPNLTASTILYVTQTVANCEGAASAVPVTIQPAKVSLEVEDDTLIATAGDSYQWYYEGQPLARATARQYVVRNSGHYHVVMQKAGCTVISDPLLHTVYVPNASLTFAPNPSSERVQVTMTSNGTGRVAVRVYNMLGQLVQQIGWHKPTTILQEELDIVQLLRGVYYVEVSTGQETLVKKLVRN